VTLVSLVGGALRIAILWAAGVTFPLYPPPGIVILLAGAVVVGLAPWRWTPGVGAVLGLFVTLRFLISGGLPNLVGGDGSSFFGTRTQSTVTPSVPSSAPGSNWSVCSPL